MVILTASDRFGSRPDGSAPRRRDRGANATRGSPSKTASESSGGSSSASGADRGGPPRHVRGFIQRLESGPGGAVQARLGTDLQALDEGSATAVLAVTGPSTTRAIGEEGHSARGGDGSPTLRRRIRLVIGQPPVRPNQERLSLTYW